jgi:hypothetical protein
MDMDFFRTPRGMLALAVFIIGTALYSGPSMQSSLAEIPWDCMPAATAQASANFYDATFMQAAAGYLVFLDQVEQIQVDAYGTLGQGAAAAIGALAETRPVAAAAEWYVDAQARLDSRLSPH